MITKRLAIIMTCHNRKAKTLSCIKNIYKQIIPENITFSIYLVDDGSIDGTVEEINASYTGIKIIKGDGALYWNGGMYRAFSLALKYNYDYYLWLNDDTLLYEDALNKLLTTSEALIKEDINKNIVIGSTCDSSTGQLTYGGVVRNSWWHPMKFKLVKPQSTPLLCDTMNGNCVLIPRDVADLIGSLDPSFTHGMGDYDYGLRARQKKCLIWIAPGYIGTCSRNPSNIFTSDLSLRDKFKKVNGAKGLPFKDYMIFTRRHAGLLWPLYFIMPYIRLFLWKN